MTTVLVVDDNPATLRMLTAVLRTDGYRVLGATDGEAALALVARERPELCLIDIILPGFDGYELARRLRALPSLVDVPLIALSGLVGADVALGLPSRTSSDSEHHDTHTSAPFDAWVVKPVEPDSLLKLIAAHLPVVPATTVAPRSTRVLVVDDDPVQAKLARLHLSPLGFEVTLARSGAEALATALTLRPDAIVSDVLMPDMDGFELCFAIRSEPSLSRVPVLLVSAHYRDLADQELARRVGANALLVKTADLVELANTIGELVRSPPGFFQPSEKNGHRIKEEHRLVISSRLERAIAATLSMSQRCSILSAQLSLISSIADALTQAARVDAALQEVLETCFDAAGISRGVLFLDRGKGPQLAAVVGFGGGEMDEVGQLFGHLALLERVIDSGRALALPAKDPDARIGSAAILAGSRASSAHIVPLAHDESLRGALFLASATNDLAAEGQVTFARAIGGQIVKSLALSRSFERIAESEARYRTLMNRASCGVFTVVGTNATITSFNDAAGNLFGVTPDGLEGRSLRDFILPEDRGRLDEVLRRGPWETWHEVGIVGSKGRLGIAELSMSRVGSGEGELVLVIANDVTERRQQQEKAALTERLTTIGTLAAGVAHEINNPATYVLANLDTLGRLFESAEKSHHLLRAALLEPDLSTRARLIDEALGDRALLELLGSGSALIGETVHGAERIRGIAKGMRDLAGQSELSFTPTDLNALIGSTLNLVAHQVKSHATMVTDLAVGLPTIVASPSRLSQVFINLIVNAAQAIGEGRAADNTIRISTRLDGERARVDIEDTGPGIPPHAMPRLFDPFFTTKPAGVGTGLGLAISQEIVHAHGGEMRAENLARGARFSVFIPLGAPATVPTPTESRTVPRPNLRRSKVLLVDDELYLLRAVQRMLAREFEVTAATGGRMAIELLEKAAPDTFDVVVSDLSMPEVSGMDLHAWLVEHRPALARRTVFATGGAFTSQAREFLDRVANPRIEKPFTLPTIVGVIRSIETS